MNQQDLHHDEYQFKPLSQPDDVANGMIQRGTRPYEVTVRIGGRVLSKMSVLAFNPADAIVTMLQHMQRDDGLAIPFMTVKAGAMK